MQTDGGGWIVFQRRVDATVDFYRGWNEYKSGFGNPNGNFWLGLEKIHRLTAPGKGAILRVDIRYMSYPNDHKYAEYSSFSISDEANGYHLTIGGYSGNAGDSLTYHNNMKFTTKDNDQDPYYSNCAVLAHGAWWYNGCIYSNLNGIFPGNSWIQTRKYMTWYHLNSKYGNIIFSEMKIRYSSP